MVAYKLLLLPSRSLPSDTLPANNIKPQPQQQMGTTKPQAQVPAATFEDETGDPAGSGSGSGSTVATATAAAAEAQGIFGRKKPYCLRAHVFQCRGLPSSEASGLLDPYIKVDLVTDGVNI